MKALIIGSTGATGKDLVDVLLQDPNCTEVVAFVRRPAGREHPKLREIITDFAKLDAVSDFIRGDVWFTCLGTTLKAAGSKQKQWDIDYGIPAAFAALARENGVPRAVVLSAYGASASSKVFYSQIKGKLDDLISGLGFEQCVIFRPGFLLRPETDRAMERIIAATLGLVNRLGLFQKFRPLPTRLLAEKLALAPTRFPSGRHVVELEEVYRI